MNRKLGGLKRPPEFLTVLGLLLVLAWAGCAQEPEPETEPKTEASQTDTALTAEKKQAEGIFRQLYKSNFADDVDTGKPLVEPVTLVGSKAQHSGFFYNRLNGGVPFRKLIYPISDRVIKKEFNKPGTPDEVPRIDAATLKTMQAQLKPGDIILCGNNDSFVHAIVYLGNDQIIHALAQLDAKGRFLGTVKETLSSYVERVERDKFMILRKPGITPADVDKMSRYAHAQLGKSYDSMFLLKTPDRLYCTEIVYHTLQQIQPAPRVYPHKAKYGWHLFTVEDIMDSPDLETVWTYNRTRPKSGALHVYQSSQH